MILFAIKEDKKLRRDRVKLPETFLPGNLLEVHIFEKKELEEEQRVDDCVMVDIADVTCLHEYHPV